MTFQLEHATIEIEFSRESSVEIWVDRKKKNRIEKMAAMKSKQQLEQPMTERPSERALQYEEQRRCPTKSRAIQSSAGIAGTDWNLPTKESNLVFYMGKGMAGNLQKRKSKRPDLLFYLSGQCGKVFDSVLWSNAVADDSAN